MLLEGKLTRLRALEAEDLDLLYAWENDPAIWGVSGTVAPFSRLTLRRFLDEQRLDLYAIRQLRLVIETLDGRAVGLLDLFEFEPRDLRAGIGILIHDRSDRGQGFAADALGILCRYAQQTLGLHHRIHRVRPQTRMASHPRRLDRRDHAAKDNITIRRFLPRRDSSSLHFRRSTRTDESGVR